MKPLIIKFYATLRELTGIRELEIMLKKPVMFIDLLKLLEEKNINLTEQILDLNKRKLGPAIIVLINDRELTTLNGLSTILKNGDTIAFIPIVHGG
ncbi:MAG: MoaD/ThiS family protein [Candidatus Odinarchaeia archaeon]